ncbi:hypothetical protein WJX74_004666 [Apatococcus lobatus]|uniref:Uncharacterized protein n=1 Tax=Apatococcus lobatus TaxID=904363 RepID=A0AAW1RYE9_9CHLO
MDDPLVLLREYMIGKRIGEIELSDAQVVFGDTQTFPQDVRTSYKSQRGTQDFYTLNTLLFFCKSYADDPQKRPGAYIREARDAGQAAVNIVDSTDLLSYLTGKTETSTCIQTMAPELLLPSLPDVIEGPAVTGEDAIDRPSKRSRLDKSDDDLSGEARALKAIFAQERQLRDRNSQLMVPGRTFKRVLDILAKLQAAQAAAASRPSASKPHASSRPHHLHAVRKDKPGITLLPSQRFDRPRTEHDPGSEAAKEFGIKAYGTGKDTGGPSDSADAGGQPMEVDAAPPPPPPDAPSAPAPHSSALSSRSSQHSTDPHRRSSSSHPAHKPHSLSHIRPTSTPAAPTPKHKPAVGTPIILVPAGATSKINIWNVKSFLEKGEYKTADACKQEGDLRKPDGTVEVWRKQGRQKPVLYHAMEGCPAKTDATWRRVVAVFVQGKKWQFKGWPFKGAEQGDLVDTFSRILGIHLFFHDEQVDPNVKAWNVKLCSLQRAQRHKDPLIMGDFWKWLDIHLKGRNSQLTY